MKRTAHIIIGEKFVSLGAHFIKSDQFNPPQSYDTLSIKNVINILEEKDFNVELITYYDLMEKSFYKNDVFIVSQWLLNRFRESASVLIEIRKKINQLSTQGNHFILMHHFWPEEIFYDVLDIGYYMGDKSGFFKDKFSLVVNTEHNTLSGVRSFLEQNSDQLQSDEFTFLFKQDGKFRVLIQKIPRRKEPKNFISFGYQKNNNSYCFLIDIHNAGKVPAHTAYFEMLFKNTIEFFKSDSGT